MSNYFEKVERVIRDEKIICLDVWNIDETNFQISCGKT